jgi:hypothetical protein
MRNPGPLGRSGTPADDGRILGRADRAWLTRARMMLRDLIEWEQLPRNGVVLHARVDDDTLARFKQLIAREYGAAKTLADTEAGRYLDELSKGRLKSLLPSGPGEWNDWRYAVDGTHESLNGMWRELSARFVQRASGIVHVLVDSADRLSAGVAHWDWQHSSRTTISPDLDRFRTLGFVEYPILKGRIGSNKEVTEVIIYGPDFKIVKRERA